MTRVARWRVANCKRRPGSMVCTLILAALSGCAGPLAPRAGDFGRRVVESDLREVEPMSLTPAPAHDNAGGASGRLAGDLSGLERVPLSLEQARAAVLENNLDLRVQLLAPTIAEANVSAEDAAFESVFTLNAFRSDTDSPTASSLDDAQAQFWNVTPGVSIPLRTGGRAEVTLPVSRNRTNNTFSTLNPSYTSDLQFSISHPLLRGAGRRSATHALRVAGYNRDTASVRTRLEAIRQIAGADRAYWRAFGLSKALEVAQQQYELANAQLERARRQFRAERVAEVEVIRAEAGVAQRLEAIISAENALLLQQRELKRVLNLPGLGVGTSSLIDVESVPDPVRYELHASGLADRAVDQRMEMLEAELDLAIQESQIAFARNQALPLLSMNYVYRINGLGESMGDAMEDLGENRFEDWQLGLSAEVPIGNERASARVREALLRRVQSQASRSAREQSIRKEVHDAIDTLSGAWQRILAARQSVILETRVYEAEQRQFDAGARTSTDVLEAAARLAEAQIAEIRALVDYQIAQVDLAFATGTVLGSAKVRWDPGEPGVDDRAGPWTSLIDTPSRDEAPAQ